MPVTAFCGLRGGCGYVAYSRRGCLERTHSWVVALAEDGGANADAGAALFDRDGEVVGHADGELSEGGVELLLLVAEAAEMLEVGASSLGVFGQRPRRDGHEAAGDEVFEWGDFVEEGRKVFGGEAVLGLFVREFDLDQDGEFFVEGLGGGVEALGDLERVDGVDSVKKLGSFAGLVGLERADEMHFEAGAGGQVRRFFCELLHTVFAEEALARGVGFKEALDGVTLLTAMRATSEVGRVGVGAGRCDLFVDAAKLAEMDMLGRS